jgi:hypothetical protein
MLGGPELMAFRLENGAHRGLPFLIPGLDRGRDYPGGPEPSQ